ncbi:hypothetical protein LCGC14_0842600 [marine sediment metagenome]|uniref:Uncharacterized protein n=1 Tax=marine sediment metagenome TaxID=412755 RepID=A0A0F9PXW3_9ZZZZ
MKGVVKCNGCGYDLNPKCGGTTKYNGKRYHVSCLEAKLFHQHKTEELLKDCPKLRKIMLGC